MTVLSVGFPYAAIGPKAVGGAEVICTQLEAAIVERGAASVVVAHADSLPAGKLYGTRVPPGLITEEVRAEVEAAHQRNIDQALRDNAVSVVHMHGLDFQRYRIPEDIPVLVTLHLPPEWYPEEIWGLPENYHLVCVSESQLEACPPSVKSRLECIGNGVSLPPAASLRATGRYALMLARICREKNLHVGLEAARAAAMPLLLGGEVFPYEDHLRYFAEEIEPRLTNEGNQHEARSSAAAGAASARFLGPVAGEEKARLLSRAACLLLPSLAPETSSLVAMEALAAGVPVIGMRVGAVPEIVQHGVTGFLIEPGDGAVAAMAEAIRHLDEIDRKLCRSSAEERFPLERMTEQYMTRYQQLAAGRDVQAAEHSTSSDRVETEQSEAGASACRMEDFSVEILSTDASLEALLPEWSELWHRDVTASPFQHPAWLWPWWQQFGPDGHLQAVMLRTGPAKSLSGLLPTYVYQADVSAERQLLLMGAGTTDYLDGVWASAGAAEAGLWHAQKMAGWEVLHFDQLRQESALQRAAATAGMAMGEGEPCAVLDGRVPLPAKIRANVGRYRRRAEEQGRLTCRLAQTTEEALADFALLVQFTHQRWEERGEAAVLDDPRVQAHHRASLPQMLEAGLLRLFCLSLREAPIGILYGLADGEQVTMRRLYLYLIGFDSRFAEISPGTLLLHAAWNHAQESHFTAVDMLRGGESYKQLWGATHVATVRASSRREHGRAE